MFTLPAVAGDIPLFADLPKTSSIFPSASVCRSEGLLEEADAGAEGDVGSGTGCVGVGKHAGADGAGVGAGADGLSRVDCE